MKGHALAAVGEILVEFVSHRTGCELSTISDYSGPYPSGAPAIFADQAARLGAASRIVGGLGQDGFGRLTLSRLEADGVAIDAITVDPSRPTGTAFVSYAADGSRVFIFHMAGTAADRVAVPTETLQSRPTILHVSAASLGHGGFRAAIAEAAEAVVAGGGCLSCDPNARPELMRDDEARTALIDAMARARILMPSTGDLPFLYPDLSQDDAVARLLGYGAEIVVLKRGAEGASVFADGVRFDVPPHPVDEVDPTGAGDAFCGTFLAELAAGRAPQDAGRRANAAGAIAVTRRGPMEGNSSPGEIDAFLQEAGA